MTTDRPTVAGTATTVLSADLSYLVRRRIFLYLGILIVMLAFGAPGSGLIDIPITFLLKNKLHLTILFKDRACEARSRYLRIGDDNKRWIRNRRHGGDFR
jgi:hypothetical protein